MKYIIVILVLLIFYGNSLAQPIGNEWINYSQSYFKIKINQEGIYRIDLNTLQNAGIDPNAIDPRSIQLFKYGEEQYIYIPGEKDGRFDGSDYIEFYGTKNDGRFDIPLFDSPSSQANPDYSLFNDTAIYFLTFNNLISNRRMKVEDDNNFSAYQSIPFFYKRSRVDYSDHYFLGDVSPDGISDPDYISGEGWFDNGFKLGGTITKSLNTRNSYVGGPPANIECMLIGQSNYQSVDPDHHVRITFAGKSFDTIFEGFKMIKLNYSVSPAELSTTNTQFTFTSINDLPNNQADRNTIAYLQVKYPHTFQLGNDSSAAMYIPDSPQIKSLLNMTSLAVQNNDTVRLFDLTNHKRIAVYKNGNAYSALIANTGAEKFCYITSDHQIKSISSLIPVNTNPSAYAKFINYCAGKYINSDYLIITHKRLLTGASQYSSYRNSTGYKTLLADVDDLYDQYAYGIGKHPLAIRNFIRDCLSKFSINPKYLFLIGKAYRSGDDSEINSVLKFYRKDPLTYDMTLVPSMGTPPSDILLTAHLNDPVYYPALATGRLSAKTNEDVLLYLNKVKEHETALKHPQEWMKQVLHFGGGVNLNQQNIFKQYLNNYKNIIEDTLFGGHVNSFFKTSATPFQINRSDSLKNMINNGISMMTFFGHASGIGFDESIDYPSEYNNQGKYPFMIANSCFAGDIFSEQNSSSEIYVLIANKGAIAYLASITKGIDYYLNIYSDELYRNIAYKNYGKSLGTSIQQTIKTIQVNDFNYKNLIYEFVYHGDPAICLSSSGKPDYTISPSSVYFTPENVTGDLKSFNINIIATNLGKAVHAEYIINITRTFPDGSQKDTNLRVHAPMYQDTVTVSLDVNSFKGIGLNTLKITLDAWNEISELSKLNNSVTVVLPITSYDIMPVYPYEYSVIPQNKVTLKAYTGNPFAPERKYVFEIDTTDLFLNPLARGIVSHAGGVVTWDAPVAFAKDSTVFFWRVGIDSSSYGKYNWRESSFQYISGKRGWGQAHFFQFKKDNFKFIKYDHLLRSFQFSNDIKALTVQTGYYPYIDWREEWCRVNGFLISEWSCLGDRNGGVKFMVFDPVTGDPWLNSAGNPENKYTGKYLSYQCKNDNVRPGFDYPTQDFSLITQQEWFSRMKGFIDSVPEGYFFLTYSHRDLNSQFYPPELQRAFKSCGCQNIVNAGNKTPYICFGKKYKDTIHSSHEITAVAQNQIIQLKDSIVVKWNEGYIQSTLIGPAFRWNSLHWRSIPKEKIPVTDTVMLKVIGIKKNGDIDTVIRNLPPIKDSIDITDLYNRIDAAVYPYLKLILFTKDNLTRTPTYLKRWHVLFDEVPETAIDPSIRFSFFKDTLTEGEKVRVTIATHNISDFNFKDTIINHYWLIDQSRVVHELAYKKTRLHPSADILIDSISFPSNGLRGLNSLWVEVNPVNPLNDQYFQPEQFHFNNILQKNFYVGKDKTNPILDLTFDGVHILNGDIVSGKPEVMITLNDENKYLLLNDTSLFRIYLKTPTGESPKRIYFMQNGIEILKFTAATLPKNTARIEWDPVFTEDGNYELLIKATDKSGNISGSGYPDASGLHDYDYQISFQVINKSTITEVLNWPNPFTTSTRFVFILTGNEIPTYFKIQIMSITGKIVKEITQDEIGPIHIGRNITDYVWDGTDQYGDRLANGVYLYRIVTNIRGNDIEKRNTEADKYFTKGWGKMYLMR